MGFTIFVLIKVTSVLAKLAAIIGQIDILLFPYESLSMLCRNVSPTVSESNLLDEFEIIEALKLITIV